jgi:HlyD family secretion protein/GAF domain-containing protein
VQPAPVTALAALRHFEGPAKEFWPKYLELIASITCGSKVALLVKAPDAPSGWKILGGWAATNEPSRVFSEFQEQLIDLAKRCESEGSLLSPLKSVHARAQGHFVIAAQLALKGAQDAGVVAVLLSEVSDASARAALTTLQLAADVPESYQLNHTVRQAKADVEKLAIASDVMAAVNKEKHFVAAALTFCNALASHFRCERVSLGWLEGGYVRMRAISRTEKFDRQMQSIQSLQSAMEEALDQDDEVVWPEVEGSSVVTRDHAKCFADQKSTYVCSLPLRSEGKAVAVITCERQNAAFSNTEVMQLRVCCDQAAARLVDLRHYDRWLGARFVTWLRAQFAKALKPQHTWAKVLGLLIAGLIAALFLVKVTYRVEGDFTLRSDEVAFLTVPYDGYISKVFVRPGDAVQEGAPLLQMDTAELELEQSAALADLHRYEREAEKARAAKQLAEMRIAQAMAEQAKARLDLVRYRVEKATIRSPFRSVVVDGDLRERLGAPIKQGEALFKLARTDRMYVEGEIRERDIHEILGRSSGEIAFVSQPKLKFPVQITTVEPAAVPKQGGNVFLVRCAAQDSPPEWWRPGMSGLVKLNVEPRTLFWIVTHRTTDFLRMKLWW